MEIEVMQPVKLHVDAIRVRVPVRYDEDLEDLRQSVGWALRDRTLTLELEIDTRRVRNWPAGFTADIHLKVVDTGVYELLADGRPVASRVDDYVPGVLPGEHYGDYLILSIDAEGRIADWNPGRAGVRDAFWPED